MGQELLSMSRMYTKRLLWLMVLIFAMILAFQYFELPYGFSLPSLLSPGKVPAIGGAGFPAGDPLSNTEFVANTKNLYSINFTSSHDGFEIINNTATSEEHGKHEFVPEEDQTLNKSLGLDKKDNAYKTAPSEDLVEPVKNSTVDDVSFLDDESISDKWGGNNQSFSGEDNSTLNDSIGFNGTESYVWTLGYRNRSDDNFATPPAVAPSSSSTNASAMIVGETSIVAKNISGTGASVKSNTPDASVKSETYLKEKVQINSSAKHEKTEKLHGDLTGTRNKSSAIGVSEKKKVPKVHSPGLYTISDMDSLLFESRACSGSIIPRWNSTADQELLHAKLQIENAPVIDNNPNLYAALFRNVSIFKRSYELMERTLKVYIYREGEKPIFHQAPLQSIYASEGWFMKILESNKRFVTKNPKKAHLFYLPFSSRNLEEFLYVRDSHSHKNLIQYLKNYLDLISAKYPYWNRTGGADHFLVACHDWAPSETRTYMANCIRALCNSDVREGFVFGKDVSLPETFVRMARNPLRDVGGNPSSKRAILAFFAGNMHGYLRSILLQHWENKDPAMKISGPLPKVKGAKNYIWHMKNSKYCICAKGYEVNSPRVVEAILYECVPVIISDNFVPPLFEVLNWESFAIFVLEKDIPHLKKILLSIPEKRYREMQMRVKKLQPHFLWHARPVKYDMFHMILHSIWYNRLYQIRPR